MPFLLQAPIKIVYIALLTICMVLKAATMELAFIVKKLILGMTLAAPIGPVSVEMIKRGLSHGFLSAFSVRLGGAFGNSLCLLAAYYGLSYLVAYPHIFNILGVIGSLLLIYMGYSTLQKGADDIGRSAKGSFGDKKAKTQLSRDARTESTLTFPRSRFTSFSSKTATLSPSADLPIEGSDGPSDSSSALKSGLRWGLYLAIANPFAFVFWTGIFAATLDSNQAIDHRVFLENLFIVGGVLLWGAGLSVVLGFGHRFLNKKVIVRLSQIAALFMFYFGLKYLWVISNRIVASF